MSEKRIRSRGDYGATTYVRWNHVAGAPVTTVANGFSYSESMTDYVAKPLVKRPFRDPSGSFVGVKPGQRKFFGPGAVDHLITDARTWKCLPVWYYLTSRDIRTPVQNYHKLWVPPGVLSSYMDPMNADLAEELCRNAFEQFDTQFPVAVSLPNFLIELVDPIKGLGEMKFHRRKIREDLEREHGRNLSKDLAGGYLGYEFGIAPFVDDLNKLANIVSIVSSGLDVLAKSKGKWSKLNFRRSMPPPLASGKPAFHNVAGFTNNNSPPLRLSVSSFTSEFRAGAWLYHDLDLTSTAAKVRAYSAALGLLNPFEVFWEAVPFSFVVDWITDVSGILASLRARPFLGKWHIRDLTWSVKDTATFKVEADYYLPPSTWMDAGTVTHSRYIRRIGLPARAAGLSLPLTAKQSLLSIALATGMVPDLQRRVR